VLIASITAANASACSDRDGDAAWRQPPVRSMPSFSALDYVALALFLGAWAGYALLVEFSTRGHDSLNARMNRYRVVWMQRMQAREMRMVDMQVMASLQNGTAFFASTSLIAIGAALTLLRSTDEILSVMAGLPFSVPTTRSAWEVKTIGLIVIFAYAFFKFAWSYRLFNYVAILLGAAPPAADKDTPEAAAHVLRTARLFQAAGRHFNRGQRAFFFALGYLGWFVSPWVLMAATAAVVLVMGLRQFRSDARDALAGPHQPAG
jgi:uncharacterized membrane protein